ncbi:MAG: hypothetical protein ABSH25_20150 [Syntrophorhabdales bacterium]
MSQDYQEMWGSLGLNLEAHQGLLAVLSDAYQGIYLSQKDRPAAMQYFDFVVSEVHGLRIVELLKAKTEGKLIVGTFCVYVPEELILAADGVPSDQSHARAFMSKETSDGGADANGPSRYHCYFALKPHVLPSSST